MIAVKASHTPELDEEEHNAVENGSESRRETTLSRYMTTKVVSMLIVGITTSVLKHCLLSQNDDKAQLGYVHLLLP